MILIYMKDKNIQYYVEGKDEEKLLAVLKTEMQNILPGKVQVFNAVSETITNSRLMTLKQDTIVVLVFDTDVNNCANLQKNLDILRKNSRVADIVLIPQCKNLEDELVRSCQIRKITDLLDSKGKSNFKSDFIRITNLRMKLEKAKFDINKLWCKNPDGAFQGFPNDSKKIKKLD